MCVCVCPFVCGGKVHLDGSSTFQQIELAVVQWVHNGMLTKANVITLIEDELHLTWELTQVEQLLLKKAHIYTMSTGDGVISFKNAVNILFNERVVEVVTSRINLEPIHPKPTLRVYNLRRHRPVAYSL